MKVCGERIKELRMSKGISQNQLSKILGLSQPVISQWEAGKQWPSADYLIKLADYFNCSVDFILGRVDD